MQMSGKSEARIIGSAVAGVSELALFHPVDTVAKRLMSTWVLNACSEGYVSLIDISEFLFFPVGSETQLITLSSPAQTAANLNTAIFRNSAAESLGQKAVSLFPGIGFGAAYKILQRVYKFGGQVSTFNWFLYAAMYMQGLRVSISLQ